MSWAYSCVIPEDMFGVTKEKAMEQLQLFATKEESVLSEAQRIVDGQRQGDYGSPEDNFARIAAMWSVLLGVEISPRKVALCMIALKLARDTHQAKRDNLVDIAGYAQCAHTCGK